MPCVASICEHVLGGSSLTSAGECRFVGGVADLAQGKGPTITQAADGTLQVLTNNNSGDEVQFQRDGTLTWVNGGNAPGIFSVSLQILSAGDMAAEHEGMLHQYVLYTCWSVCRLDPRVSIWRRTTCSTLRRMQQGRQLSPLAMTPAQQAAAAAPVPPTLVQWHRPLLPAHTRTVRTP